MKKRSNEFSGLCYGELLQKLAAVRPGKEARRIHRELKKHGSGLSFSDRYPMAITIIVSALSAIVTNAILLAIGY